MPVVLVGSAFATSALTLQARELAAALVATLPLRSADLPDVVALALVLVGAAVAGWYLLSALTAATLLLARVGGGGGGGGGGGATMRLQAWLARWGAPALRRACATTAVASMGLGVAVSTSAVAAPTDGPSTTVEVPALSAKQVDPVPADLGWGAPTPSERPDEHAPAPSSTAVAPAGTSGVPTGSTPAPRASSAAGVIGAAPRVSAPGPPDPLVSPAPTSAPRPDQARNATTETTTSVGPSAPSDPTAAPTGAPVARTAAPATPGARAGADRGRASAPGTAPGAETGGPTPTGDGAAAHLVRAGESLWSVAAGHLGAGASDADVADAWPRWYRENVATIGPDPNLIHPGQLLQAPSEEIP